MLNRLWSILISNEISEAPLWGWHPSNCISWIAFYHHPAWGVRDLQCFLIPNISPLESLGMIVTENVTDNPLWHYFEEHLQSKLVNIPLAAPLTFSFHTRQVIQTSQFCKTSSSLKCWDSSLQNPLTHPQFYCKFYFLHRIFCSNKNLFMDHRIVKGAVYHTNQFATAKKSPADHTFAASPTRNTHWNATNLEEVTPNEGARI